MSKLADLGRKTWQAFGHRPDLMICMLPPWGFMPSVRSWVMEQVELEETEMKLRAVIPADEMDAVMEWIDDAVERLNTHYAEVGISPTSRLEVMRAYFRTYCLTGEHPKPEDYH